MSPVLDHDRIVAFTQELVRIESVNDPDAGLSEQPVAEAVAAEMRSFGWEPVLEEVAPGRPNVICVVDGGLPGPTLMFEGHSDVVTAGDKSKWTIDPYAAEIVDGRLYGRGSADMKSGVAAMIHATRAVELAGPFPGKILIGVLCDEEEMMLGAKHFVAAGHCDSIDGAISAEPEEGEICAVSKGAVRLRIDARGAMAHGAMPFKGANPLSALAEATTALAALQERLQRDIGPYEHLGEIYVTPTFVSGGSVEQLNVIPADASMAVDIRTTPDVDHAELIDEVRRILADSASAGGTSDDGVAVTLELTVLDERPCTNTPTDAPVVAALAAAHEAVTGEAPRYGGVPGSTDGTILWAQGGLDSVVYGPGGKWIAHQVDEYVDVEEIIVAAEVFARAALEFAHSSAFADKR